MYREEITEELLLGYSEGLRGLRDPLILHRAFMRAMRMVKFRPTIEEVIAAYQEEELDAAPRPQLSGAEMTEEEKADCRRMSDELRARLGTVAVPPRHL